jgi:hypothetical protein
VSRLVNGSTWNVRVPYEITEVVALESVRSVPLIELTVLPPAIPAPVTACPEVTDVASSRVTLVEPLEATPRREKGLKVSTPSFTVKVTLEEEIAPLVGPDSVRATSVKTNAPSFASKVSVSLERPAVTDFDRVKEVPEIAATCVPTGTPAPTTDCPTATLALDVPRVTAREPKVSVVVDRAVETG